MQKHDESWMKKMLSKGTYKDKISTLCIYARDNTKYSLKTVENLLEMVFLFLQILNKQNKKIKILSAIINQKETAKQLYLLLKIYLQKVY